MNNMEKVEPTSEVAGFLKVLDYLEANGGSEDEIAYYVRQYLANKYGVPSMPEPAPAAPAAPADPATQAVDPNAAAAPVDPNTQQPANSAQPSA